MSTNSNEEKKVPEPPIFEPFPKPNTMPDGWDLSALVSAPVPVSAPAVNNSADTTKQ